MHTPSAILYIWTSPCFIPCRIQVGEVVLKSSCAAIYTAIRNHRNKPTAVFHLHVVTCCCNHLRFNTTTLLYASRRRQFLWNVPCPRCPSDTHHCTWQAFSHLSNTRRVDGPVQDYMCTILSPFSSYYHGVTFT